MIAVAARRVPLLQAVLLCAGLASAIALRVAVAGEAAARSAPAAAAFGVALLGLAAAAGWRPGRPTWRAARWGAGGGLALLLVPVGLRVAAPSPLRLASAAAGFPEWVAVITLVAVAEETLLRGALIDAVLRSRRASPEAAVAVAAIAFALLHLPLYGWGALPLDLAAGVWLGGLRLAGGGVGAPAAAHAIADLATWWLR